MKCIADHSNDIISGIIIGSAGGFVAGISIWIVGILRDSWLLWRDKRRIFSYLKTVISSKSESKWKSVKNISSFTNLPIDRVTYVCSKHKKIVLSTEEKDELWGIKGVSRI